MKKFNDSLTASVAQVVLTFQKIAFSKSEIQRMERQNACETSRISDAKSRLEYLSRMATYRGTRTHSQEVLPCKKYCDMEGEICYVFLKNII